MTVVCRDRGVDTVLLVEGLLDATERFITLIEAREQELNLQHVNPVGINQVLGALDCRLDCGLALVDRP